MCLALLLANTLRIIFWFGKHYETPLLIQSVLMNIAMFALIHLCVTINNKVSCSDGVSRNKINIEQNVLFFPASAVSWWNWWALIPYALGYWIPDWGEQLLLADSAILGAALRNPILPQLSLEKLVSIIGSVLVVSSISLHIG